MTKVVMITNFFAPIRVIESSMTQVYKTIGNLEFRHLAINNHYPINKELNNKMIKILCDHYGIELFDEGKNLGLSGGLNYLIKEANLNDEDIIIGLDNDVWPETQGWGTPLVDCIRYGYQVGWSSLIFPIAEKEIRERGYTIHTIRGNVVWETHAAVCNSICAWNVKMLKEINGIEESGHFYGGLESATFDKIKKFNWKWVFLTQYEEKFNEKIRQDKCYDIYKWEYAHKKSTTLDFESWILEDPSRIQLQ